jgi:hypothetical protein
VALAEKLYSEATMSDCDPKGQKHVQKLTGAEGAKTNRAACQAVDEGRYGYAALMEAKLLLYNLPVHQFSPGDTPKPAETPVVKSQDPKATGK